MELERKRALLSAHSVKAAEMAGFTAELTHRIAHRSEPFRCCTCAEPVLFLCHIYNTSNYFVVTSQYGSAMDILS